MNQILFPLALVSFVALGCTHSGLSPKTQGTVTVKVDKDDVKGVDERSGAETAGSVSSKDGLEGGSSASETQRKPGDFVVYRFSGSFRKTPLTLTERVIEREGAILTVDVTADSGANKRAFRVKIDDTPEGRKDVVGVAELEGGVEKAVSLEAYEAFMAEATLAADQNEAFLGGEEVLVDIGGVPLPCHKLSFRVRIGKKEATLSTLSSEGFAWGDVGGEITSASGKILYRAEVVEVGHSDPAKLNSVAHSDGEP